MELARAGGNEEAEIHSMSKAGNIALGDVGVGVGAGTVTGVKHQKKQTAKTGARNAN